jgi:hypothetical protein
MCLFFVPCCVSVKQPALVCSGPVCCAACLKDRVPQEVCPQGTELIDDSARGAFELCAGGPFRPRCASCAARPSHLCDMCTAASSPLQAVAPSCPSLSVSSLAATAPCPPRLDRNPPDILLDNVAAAEVDGDAIATAELSRPAAEGSEDGGAEVGMISVPEDILSCLLKRLEKMESALAGMAPSTHGLGREVWACYAAYLQEVHLACAWCTCCATVASPRRPWSPRTERYASSLSKSNEWKQE